MPHTHESLCPAVDVVIVHKNRVLLRYHDKYDLWLFPGGHVDPGEDPVEAIIREAREETGLEIKVCYPAPGVLVPGDLPVPRFANRHRVSETHEHYSSIYLATSETDVLSPREEEKPVQMHWFNYNDLHLPQFGVSEAIRDYAKIALYELRGGTVTRRG